MSRRVEVGPILTLRCRVAVVFAAAVTIAAKAGAQLRPLEPAAWTSGARPHTWSVQLGASRLAEQRASLAGTTGTLLEAANFMVSWRTGRVILDVAGTVQRFFDEKERFTPPFEDVRPSMDGKRHDSGDYRISTSVVLTPPSSPSVVSVRFGTRLPTTDNRTGLDRDAIDFFATVGASSSFRQLRLAGEGGLGIHTTRNTRFEQDDLFVYAISAEVDHLVLIPSIALLGQLHGAGHSELRGVEDLGELRVGLRAGRSRWVRLEVVRGYEPFSPSSGFIITVGFRR